MGTETSLIWQLACFSLCGVFLGIGYELLRILRLIIPHHNFAVGVEDTFYLALCGVILFGLAMETGNGNFRLSYLIAALAGSVVYLLTVGRLVKLVYSAIIKTLIKILKFLIGKFLKPLAKWFVSIAHKTKRPFVKIYENTKAKMKKRKADLKKAPEMLYNNDINHERNELTVGGSIKGKVRKIQ